jgi:hypothetical protein
MSLLTPHSSGYQVVMLKYTGTLLGTRRVETLRYVARDRETQILESEVDCDDEGIFSHRLLFWPRDELTIDFADLELDTANRVDDRVSLISYFVEILPDGSD